MKFIIGLLIIFLCVWWFAGKPEEGYERLHRLAIFMVTMVLWGLSLIFYGIYNQFGD